MTKVLVVDDHPIVLQGCRRILEAAGGTTVFEASDVATGYELFRSNKPDVVIIDLSMRDVGLGGLSLIRRISEDDWRVPILVLGMHRDPSLVLQALEAGAVGYVLKDTATEDLLKAIQEVQRGNRYLSHSLAIEVAVSRTAAVTVSCRFDVSRIGRTSVVGERQDLQSHLSRAKRQLQDGCEH